jgi:hypothetical protein
MERLVPRPLTSYQYLHTHNSFTTTSGSLVPYFTPSSKRTCLDLPVHDLTHHSDHGFHLVYHHSLHQSHVSHPPGLDHERFPAYDTRGLRMKHDCIALAKSPKCYASTLEINPTSTSNSDVNF